MRADEHNRAEPLAYFLTWTTYGTWLPGDERGWHAKNEWGEQDPNALFREVSFGRMKEEPLVLTDSQRDVVEVTVRRHCDLRNWMLLAIAVCSNHVHVVVTAPGYDPDTVVGQFKAWCTTALKIDLPQRKRFWTEGASKRWLNHDQSVDGAISYVHDAQDRKDLDDM